ncbi:prepilin peptidase [Sphingomonas sp. CA1-15]|uniref:Prepilin peptidase n=2 Tax=Sphingomonas immobilis TaxID=3063997 RepID=A0ABT8ZX08_9SPHN|nr:prepilin peptidase [Sphingomonas sp. CA1-15]
MALLVSAGIQDARTREIANWKNVVIGLLAPLWWVANGMPVWPDMLIQIAVASIVFGFFVGMFFIGQMGGGDVKMIGALALWFPLSLLVWMLAVMSIAGGVLTIVMMIERKILKKTTPLETPYGLAIAFASLLAVRELLFNHFGVIA